MSVTKLLHATILSAGVLLGAGCRLDVDGQAYIEREQKRFPIDSATTVADLDLKTFSGRIEIISWDRPEVLVEIEKRGEDKDAVSKITVASEQNASKISIDVRHPGRTSFGIGHFTSPSARLIVSVPRKCNIIARSGEGSISLERVEGSLDLRTDEGTIRVVESRGTLLAESNDGSMTLDDVTGHVEVRTNDGAVRVSGTPSVCSAAPATVPCRCAFATARR